MRRNLHEAAFSGPGICPRCSGERLRLLETFNFGYVYRWQCKDCLMTFREDLTPRCFYGDTTIEEREVGKPYVSYKGIANQPLNRLVKPPTKEMDWQVHVHKFQKQPAS